MKPLTLNGKHSFFFVILALGRVPMRSSPLVLLLLIGVQAVLNMGDGLDRTTRASSHKTGQQRAANHRASPDPFSPVVDPKIFSKKRYRPSPRVVFSEVPPSHDALDDEGYGIDGIRGIRVKRRAEFQTKHRGEFSVCESKNIWVGNLTKATDLTGKEVTVLPNVTINNVVKKQVPNNSDCLGIDSRHWNSYCTNTHIFVSALTTYEGRTAWRYIRINAACVCVLSAFQALRMHR
uniref:Nerve growth factor a (beta polypeptide) n=1 Tax=Oryzias sinensis TaxID=183150 RepID=A0A8C7XLM9_9TELE